MKQKVIITRGLPGSGKSTWSRAWVRAHPEFKRINRDDLRMMIYDGAWSGKKEKAILKARRALIETFLASSYSLVLDDTNLVPFRLEETKQIISDFCATHDIEVEIEIKEFFDVPLEVCIQRDSQRPDSTRVGERFIRGYYNKYIRKHE